MVIAFHSLSVCALPPTSRLSSEIGAVGTVAVIGPRSRRRPTRTGQVAPAERRGNDRKGGAAERAGRGEKGRGQTNTQFQNTNNEQQRHSPTPLAHSRQQVSSSEASHSSRRGGQRGTGTASDIARCPCSSHPSTHPPTQPHTNSRSLSQLCSQLCSCPPVCSRPPVVLSSSSLLPLQTSSSLLQLASSRPLLPTLHPPSTHSPMTDVYHPTPIMADNRFHDASTMEQTERAAFEKGRIQGGQQAAANTPHRHS